MNRIFAFADISGFTPLTAALIAKSRYGAEEVSDLVNNVFGGIIDAVHGYNGMILHFAGDALLFTIDIEYLEACRKSFSSHIESYNISNNTTLSISIDIFTEQYYPHTVKYKNSKLLFFSTGESDITYESVIADLNPSYPSEIRKMKKRGFSGELRTLPVAFIHIDSTYTTKQLKPLFYEILKVSEENKIYLNKIEYADKGWMLLLGAGMPVPLKNANLILYRVLEYVMESAKKLNISIGAGITLQRGFAGIIGNRDRWEFTFMGDNVNLAARMAVNAEKDSILCDKYMQESLSRYYDIENSENVKYKGMNAETKTFRLKAISEQEENSIFVGREKLITDIQGHIKREKTAVIITGEGGIGKTSLVKKLESISDNPYVYMSGERKEIPFSAIMSIDNKIEQYIRKGVILKSTNAKDRFFEVIGSLDTGISIVIDNAHLLDPQSLNIVKWLLIEGNSYVKIIIVQRPVNMFTAHKSPLSKYDTAEYMLQGLDRDTVRSLIKAYFDADPDSKSINHIFRLSQGNPLYITQLVNYLIKDNLTFVKNNKLHINIDLNKLPYSLKELILMKFDSLKNIEKQFIETGSVIGDEFRNDIPASISDNMKNIGSIVENASNNKLLSPKDSKVTAFYHNIVRETIYDRLLKKDVDSICIKIADYLGKSDDAFDMLQAGRFYALADDPKTVDLYMAAAYAFAQLYEYEYAAHSLMNVFNCNPDVEHTDRAFDLLRDIGRYNMTGGLLESAYNALLVNQFKSSNNSNFLLIGKYFLELQRNIEKAKKLLNVFESRSGITMESDMLRAIIYNHEEKSELSGDIYRKLLNNTSDAETTMRILIPFAQLSFFLLSDKRNTSYAIMRMKKLIRHIKDDELKRDYYGFMISYNIHINELKKGAFYAAKQKKLAIINRDNNTLNSLYNSYSILYFSKAEKEKNAYYARVAHKYSKKMYDIMKRNMQMNTLPLMTTNLAMSYAKMGMTYKALELYYEGLLYGREINHFIEIPYNLGIIAGFVLQREARDLAVTLCNEIMKKYSNSDMTAMAGTILYIVKNDHTLLKKSISAAENFLELGHTLPYMFHFSVLFNAYIKETNLRQLKKLKTAMTGFLKRSKLRTVQEADLREKIRIIDMMITEPDYNYIQRYIKKTSDNRIYRDSVIFYCYLACSSLKDSSRVEYAKIGYRYARHMLMPFYAEKFARLLKESGYNKYYYSSKETHIKSLRMDIVKTENIPEFINLIKTL